MTISNAPRAIENTIVYEGAFGRTRADRGDWTSGQIGVGRLAGTAYGIAAMTLTERGLPIDFDLSTLTKAEAIALYRKKEWQECAGDQMPKGLDQIIYDGTVNSGKGRGIPWVGKAVKCPLPAIAAAVARSATLLSFDQRKAAVKTAIAARVAFLHSLAIFKTFGVGWMRRCTGMEAIGVKMVLEDAALTPAQIQAQLQAEAGTAKKKATTAGTTATATGASGGGGATQIPEPSTLDWGAILTLGAVGLIVTAFLVWVVFQAFKNYHRNNAYLAAANGTIGG